MYKSNSNLGAGCPNWADWADLRFGFVHSTAIIEQNKNVYHKQGISMHIWWIGIENLFLKRHLVRIKQFKKHHHHQAGLRHPPSIIPLGFPFRVRNFLFEKN